jgi:hypothetical protein
MEGDLDDAAQLGKFAGGIVFDIGDAWAFPQGRITPERTGVPSK